MKEDIKNLWADALESGQYKQTKGALRKGDAFCCLGVLCNLHAQAHPEIASKQTDPGSYMSNKSFLPGDVAEWAGVKGRMGDTVYIQNNRDSLSGHNDDGRSFGQIAKAIREQL